MFNKKKYDKKYYLKNKKSIKEKYLKNKEAKIKYQKEYNLKNKEIRKEYDKKYRLENKEKIKQHQKKWREKNKETKKEYQKKYYLENRENIDKKKKEYYEKNKEKIKQHQKKYREKNKKYFNNWEKEKRKNDVNFKLASNVRTRILMALKRKRIKKSQKTIELLDCSIDELWKYLESKFEPGMTRKNHGLYGWHIDHIIPCASFDLRCPVQQLACFHYSNLQPLWAEQNLSKGVKLDYDLE